jgi:hypothetical protein
MTRPIAVPVAQGIVPQRPGEPPSDASGLRVAYPDPPCTYPNCLCFQGV